MVLFSNTAGTYTIPLAASSATERGDLQGSATSSTAFNAYDGYRLYVLATYKKNEKDFVQFRPVVSGSIDAFKAYLKLSTTDNARSMNVVIDDADGIAGIQTDGQDTDNTIFNLQGQRVSATGKGIYIVNGKKVVRRVQ